MLFGEHAVLRGYRAVVMALEPYLEVKMKLRNDDVVKIVALGELYEMRLGDYRTIQKLKFLKAVLEDFETEKLKFKQLHQTGFEIRIQSQLHSNIGFGSSAAVVAATMAALSYQGMSLNREKLLAKSLQVVRRVQGIASGSDLCASIYGGTVAYQMQTASQSFSYEKLPNFPYPMSLVYAGHKTPTSQVLEMIAKKEAAGFIDDSIFKKMGVISERAISLWQLELWDSIEELALEHSPCMRALGLYDSDLEKIEKNLLAQGILGKISGSGLGDCYLGFGVLKQKLEYADFIVKAADRGLEVSYA